MRRAIVIFVSLVLMLGVSVATYFAYCYRKLALDYADVIVVEESLSSDLTFSAKIRCELKGKYICDYKYEIIEKDLYFLVYVRASENGVLPTDEEGYAEISFNIDRDVERVYYDFGDDASEIMFVPAQEN